MSVSDEYLNRIRNALRVDSGDEDVDSEITALILAARKELETAGISSEKTADETDPQIERAVTVFVKAEFGLENADREKYLLSFDTIKTRLAVTEEYTSEGD